MSADVATGYLSYVRGRIAWYNDAANKHMKVYTGLRIVLVLTGAALPFAAAQEAQGWAVLVGIMGVVVAAATGLEGFFRPGEKWQNFRSTQVALKREEHKFLHAIIHVPESQKGLGNETYKAAYEAFFNSTDEIMRAESDRFWKLAVQDQVSEGS